MRYRMGRGEIAAVDSWLEKTLEEVRKEKGFYPTLRMLAERHTPPYNTAVVYKSVLRLIAEGRLSPEASLIYSPKKNKKN